MDRRETLKTLLGGFTGAMLGSAGMAGIPDKGPNIVIILSDDAGYADFGFTGCQDIPTPHLDRLAAEGVFCKQGYVTASTCCPSRMGLMTGRYQQRFGAECNVHVVPTPGYSKEDLGLPRSETTIATLLKKCGYATMAAGKWHLGEEPHHHPNQRGFDQFYGFLAGSRTYWASDHGPEHSHRMLRNHTPVDEPKEISYLTTDLTDEALAFIEDQRQNPFFLYLAYNAVHTPMHAPDEYIEQFSGIPDKRRRIYAAMMKAMDDNVGRVLDRLEALGLKEDTLVFFLNDNGGATNNGSNNRPLRGDKGSYWEGGIRVPYVVSWPGHLPEGKLYDQPVSSLDILPTCLAAAGCDEKPPNPLDGVNLLPYLRGEQKGRPHETFFWRFWNVAACRQGDWKLVRVAEDPLQENRELLQPLRLFNLEKDPREKQNMASRYPEIVKGLSRKLDEWEAQLAQPRWYDGGDWRKWQRVLLDIHRPQR